MLALATLAPYLQQVVRLCKQALSQRLALRFAAGSLHSSHIRVEPSVNPEAERPLYKHTRFVAGRSYELEKSRLADSPCLTNQSESSLHPTVWLI